jgi:superfamily II DNA or RNA helicase
VVPSPSLRLEFDRGTLLLKAAAGAQAPGAGAKGAPHLPGLPAGRVPPGFVFDRRVGSFRAPGRFYREAVAALRRAGLLCEDAARAYEELDLASRLVRQPFPYQAEAVEAWWAAGRRGVVVLPTGAGKTFVAQLAIERLGRSALIVTPTLDLLHQWYGALSTAFDCEVGLLGGGYHDPRPLTVTTYDSAYLHMERLGDRFGLAVFDECHHLPGPTYALAAEQMIAPFRLGLTATPEREDGGEARLAELVGPLVYRRDIRDLAGRFLADYETVQLRVRLAAPERQAYDAEREVYLEFARRQGISLASPMGWTRFLQATSRSEEGRRALLAYRAQKSIAQASEAKLRLLERLLARHRGDRVLIFTSDNATVYRIARRFLIPAITHQTPVKERHEVLQRFNAGDYPFLVTSRVLNEGVDVPAANVGIVLSGSGSVREHVQRLGRILRRRPCKQAVLYEVVAEKTAEEFVSSRRRRHSAYRPQREPMEPTHG